MTYSHAASAYREREVLTSSPSRLVVMVFDHAIANLMRARNAQKADREEERLAALAKAREAIMELLVTLDEENGGEIAAHLRSLYAFFLSSLLDAGRRRDERLLSRVIAMVTDLRDAFASIAADAARVPAA